MSRREVWTIVLLGCLIFWALVAYVGYSVATWNP